MQVIKEGTKVSYTEAERIVKFLWQIIDAEREESKTSKDFRLPKLFLLLLCCFFTVANKTVENLLFWELIQVETLSINASSINLISWLFEMYGGFSILKMNY